LIKDLGNPLFFLLSFLNYFPRTKTLKKMIKLNNLFDEIVEKKRQSVKSGEMDKKINNGTADLLEYMIQASSDPENPTLTSDELRVRIKLLFL
jgi:cytochrome P450